MLRTSSRLLTFVYATLLTIILICSTIHLSALVASNLDPNNPANMMYMSVIVSCVLAPPASFMLAIYSNRLIRVQEQLHQLATTDPLTGLLNRRALSEFFDLENARAKRTGQSMSMLLIDLDHFKRINNLHGHAGGDVVLRNLAECLRVTARYGVDQVARWGGEEFAILLTNTNYQTSLKAAKRFHQKIHEIEVLHADKKIRVSASLGVVVVRPDETMEDAVKRADACLAQAKRQGRNRIVAFPDETREAA